MVKCPNFFNPFSLFKRISMNLNISSFGQFIKYIFLIFALGNIMFFAGFPLLSMSSYLPSIKDHHNLSQWQANIIAEFLSIGISFMFLGSIFIDALFRGATNGALIVIMFGSIFLSLSYSLNGVIWIYMWSWMSYMFSHYFIGLGCILAYVGVLHLASKIIPPRFHGMTIGYLLAIFGGPGSAIFSQVAKLVILKEKSFSYYFWVCALCSGPGMMSAWILLRIVLFFIPEEEKELLPPSLFVQKLIYFKDLLLCRKRNIMRSVTSGLLSEKESTPPRNIVEENIAPIVMSQSVTAAYHDDTDESLSSALFEPMSPKNEIIPTLAKSDPFWKYLIKFDLWLIAIIYAISSSIGLFIIYNIGTIVISLGGINGEQSLHVSLLSVFNCVGRLFFGTISDLLVPRFSRSFFLGISVFLTLFAQVYLFLFTTSPSYAIAAAVIHGLAYGGTNTIMPVLVRQRFGSGHFASIMGFIMLGYQIFGGVAIATLIPAWLYEREVPIDDPYHICIGKNCFRYVYVMNICLSFIALLLSLILCLRIKVKKQFI